MFALSPFLNYFNAVFGNFCYLAVINSRARLANCLLNMVWLVYFVSWLGFSLEHFCLERNIQDLHVLSRHFDTVQVYFQFVETDRGTPNTACAELDSGLTEKNLWSAFIARSEAPSYTSEKPSYECACGELSWEKFISMLLRAESSRTDLYRAESYSDVLLRTA